VGGTISDSEEVRSEAVPPEASGPPPRSLTLMGDRYAVEREIGHGGMGRVFAARDLKLGREVAIKLLPPGAHSDEQLRRFEQEARAAGSLDHPNVLVIHDIGVLEGEPYIVSELLQGATLRKRLGGKELSPAKAVDWALQLAQGLRAAHDKGIVHRDLKPENLFVTNEGRLKILDFGIAKLAAPSAQSGTREGAILGTVGYMAPEQVRGQRADQRSDIFACGSILYEMLAGRRPFEGSSDLETASAILNQEPAPLPRHVPPELDRIVRRCLEKDPADRFHSAADLALALGTTPSLAKARLGLRRPRQYGIAAAVIALVIGVVTVLTLTRNRPPGGSKHTLAEAHAALARVAAYYDWEWANADREFKRAIDLQPNDADVYHSYSRYLAATGRVDEALENVRHAQQLDPAPLIFKANEAITLYFARQYGLAIEQLQKVAELDPNFYVAYWGLGLCLEQRGDASGAIAQFEKALALKQESNPNVLASLGHAYALANRRSDALRVLERLAALATTRYVPSYYAATVQIGLGEPGKAMALLEKSYAERSTLLGYLKMDPRFDPLRRESAFQALLSRIGL